MLTAKNTPSKRTPKKKIDEKPPQFRVPREVSNVLRDAVDVHPTITLKNLHDIVCENFDGLNITERCIQMYLVEKITFTFKRIGGLPKNRDDQDTLKKRAKFTQELKQKNISYNSNCIFVGEADFDLHHLLDRPKSERGVGATRFTYKKLPINMKVVVALSHRGIEKIEAKMITGEDKDILVLPEFVSSLIKKLENEKREPQYILLDNTTRNDNIQEYLESKTQELPAFKHQLLSLPPNSALLNPVEECFSNIKNYIRRVPLVKREILVRLWPPPKVEDKNAKCIEAASNAITPDICQEWIDHSMQYFV